MSRVGKLPIAIPADVTVAVSIDNVVSVKGPEGELVRVMSKDTNTVVESNQVIMTRSSDQREHRVLHGLTRVLVNDVIVGIEKGLEKSLELIGVGYRTQL